MRNGSLALAMVLTAWVPAFAQDATPSAPAATTVIDEACAGNVAELCQNAQAQQQAPGVQKHLGFDPLPTPPPPPQAANQGNFTPPPMPQPTARPTIPQQPPVAIPSTSVLPPPPDAPDGSPPVTVQSQPGAPAQ